jgi:hypothetical protein
MVAHPVAGIFSRLTVAWLSRAVAPATNGDRLNLIGMLVARFFVD